MSRQLSERQQDIEYRRRNHLGPSSLAREKTPSKLKCPNDKNHKIQTIRATNYIQLQCYFCNEVIAFGPNENTKGHKRIIGCKKCEYFMCDDCYESEIQTARY